VCIRYRGKVSTELLPSNEEGIFTEPLPSNDRGIFTEPLPSSDRGIHRYRHRLIFLLRRWDGLRCRDIRTKFHKVWFRHSKVNGGGTQTSTWSHKPTLFFQNKESRLKRDKSMQDLRLSQPSSWRVLSSGIQRRVVRRKSTDVSEEHVSSIFRVWLLPASRWFLVRLILRPWRWGHVPPKRRLTFNGLHGIISENSSKSMQLFMGHERFSVV
jgi:hypothetical protein